MKLQVVRVMNRTKPGSACLLGSHGGSQFSMHRLETLTLMGEADVETK